MGRMLTKLQVSIFRNTNSQKESAGRKEGRNEGLFTKAYIQIIIIFVYGLVTKESFYLLYERDRETLEHRVRKLARGDKGTNQYYTINETRTIY